MRKIEPCLFPQATLNFIFQISHKFKVPLYAFFSRWIWISFLYRDIQFWAISFILISSYKNFNMFSNFSDNFNISQQHDVCSTKLKWLALFPQQCLYSILAVVVCVIFVLFVILYFFLTPLATSIIVYKKKCCPCKDLVISTEKYQ